ncbi:MAG TPA: DNA replication protein [Alphaproteobacteria bacterium]|nr:DNA replication protein [Alphaproteobacteria bacterium]
MTGPRQFPLDLGHREARGREDFLVAPCNEDAVAWIDRWPDWPGRILALHGPRACGKSHLAEVWRATSGATVVAADTLTAGTVPPAAGSLAIEDADTTVDERALLHTLNAVREAGGSILLTGKTPPAQWRVGLPDLDSRLRAANTCGIGAPDDALLAAVLVKLFAERQITVAEAVILYLLPRIERSFDAARACVAALDRHALQAGRAVTVPLVRDVLGPDMRPATPPGAGRGAVAPSG